MTNVNGVKLLEYVRAAKKSAVLKGHGTDHDTNLIEMGKAMAYQDVERILVARLTRDSNTKP